MAGPLEDVGGIPGHNELVASLDEKGRLDSELHEFLPENYAPHAFDLKEMNKRLDRVASAWSGDERRG